MVRLLVVTLVVACIALVSPIDALDNGAGLLPPMGYNTQYDVGCGTNMNENAVKATADSLISLGLAALGWNSIQLGDCWAGVRLPSGTLSADSHSFPSGIVDLAGTLHGQGLTFGLSTSRGTTTCAGRPGSQGYEEVDADTFVAWGVDQLTETGCNAPQVQSQAMAQYELMRDGLNATGKSVFFNLAEGLEWIAPVGSEIGNSFLSTPGGYSWSGVLDLFDVVNLNEIWQYTGPGALNDAGYLLSVNDAGQFALNDNQTRAQMGQLAVMASPMIISASLDKLTDYTIDTLSNVEVIAVNQDPLAISGQLIWSSSEKLLAEGASQIWARPLVDGSWAVQFINAADETRDITCDAECFGMMGVGVQAGWGVKVRDLWNTTDLALLSEPTYTVEGLIPNGGSQLLKFTPQPVSSDAAPGPMTPGDPHSVITLDPSLQPRNQSTIPGWEHWVEQCGEFVYRYFHTLGRNYPTMGQPYYFLMTGLDANNVSHPAFHRILNNGFTPPKAGDILVAKGPAEGEFHTALFQNVQGGSATIFQANVAWDWQTPGKFLYARLPLNYDLSTSKYFMPDLPTSRFGYGHDFPVIGWIHPTGAENSLPGAPP